MLRTIRLQPFATYVILGTSCLFVLQAGEVENQLLDHTRQLGGESFEARGVARRRLADALVAHPSADLWRMVHTDVCSGDSSVRADGLLAIRDAASRLDVSRSAPDLVRFAFEFLDDAAKASALSVVAKRDVSMAARMGKPHIFGKNQELQSIAIKCLALEPQFVDQETKRAALILADDADRRVPELVDLARSTCKADAEFAVSLLIRMLRNHHSGSDLNLLFSTARLCGSALYPGLHSALEMDESRCLALHLVSGSVSDVAEFRKELFEGMDSEVTMERYYVVRALVRLHSVTGKERDRIAATTVSIKDKPYISDIEKSIREGLDELLRKPVVEGVMAQRDGEQPVPEPPPPPAPK